MSFSGLKFYFLLYMAINVECIENKLIRISGNAFNDTIGHKQSEIQALNLQDDISISFPGTKWCGPGETAKNYTDLGKYIETDKCCRDHDFCDHILGGEEKYGLKNDDWFTRLHCDCDKKFMNCLHAANEPISSVVGKNYFFFRNTCYKKSYPIIECEHYQKRFFVRRCIKYHLDTTQPKKYQWFDLPLYDIESYPNISNPNIEEFYKLQANHQQQLLLSRKLK